MAHTTAFLLIELYLPSRNRAFSLTSFLLSQRVSSVNPVGQPRQTPSAFDLACFDGSYVECRLVWNAVELVKAA